MGNCGAVNVKGASLASLIQIMLLFWGGGNKDCFGKAMILIYSLTILWRKVVLNIVKCISLESQ